MIGNREQRTGSGSESSYEAAVLDFLNREMDAAQLAQSPRSQSDDLDALVSDLLKQVMTESDGPQTVKKAAPAIREASRQEFAPSKKEVEAPKIPKTNATPQTELNPFESREQMFAEFMPHLDGTPASQNSSPSPESESQFNPFEDREDPISEYMRLQEKKAFDGEGAQLESALDASQFEGMDDVLAEYMPPEQVRSTSQAEAPAEAIAPATFGSPQAFSRTEDEAPTAADPSPSKIASSAPKDAASMVAAVPIEPVIAQQAPEIPKPKTPVAKVEEAKAAKPQKPLEKVSLPSVPLRKMAPASTKPVFAAPAARRSKTLLIAAACLCMLAAVAIPVYMRSVDTEKPAESQTEAAGAQLGPNGEIPAIPISQVSPRYPESAIKNRTSDSVTLELSIDGEGKVVNAAALSGSKLFQDEAISAARKWRYKPASLAGAPIASKSRVSLNFNLKN